MGGVKTRHPSLPAATRVDCAGRPRCETAWSGGDAGY